MVRLPTTRREVWTKWSRRKEQGNAVHANIFVVVCYTPIAYMLTTEASSVPSAERKVKAKKEVGTKKKQETKSATAMA